jgi:DNA polymerase I-like protein with 3'-5' exonuclease and polymerase domains
MKALFDIETNGFLSQTDRIHSLVITDLETNEIYSYANQDDYPAISEGIKLLNQADLISGHNIIRFDIPALDKLKLTSIDIRDPRITDTLVLSRLIYAHIKTVDWSKRFKDMPIRLYGKHSLEAWGYRLKFQKGDFGKQEGWENWSKAMQDYCEQDVKLNALLYKKLMSKELPQQSLDLEHEFALNMSEMMDTGVPFDKAAADALFKSVEPDRLALKAKLEEVIPKNVHYDEFTPKRDDKKKGYVRGVKVYRKIETTFNPGSRQQIVKFLKKKYKWNPVVFTEKGNPSVGREVLEKLSHFPEVPLIMDYLDMTKLMGSLSSGAESWLSHYDNGRIYGSIIHNGAITGRCTHSKPNLGQVPAVRSYKGKECRALFRAPDGFRFVGCDVKGLELRMLGHYLSRYDAGTYGKEVVEGDIHTLNMRAAGLNSRDDAKTFIYAHNYGAGDPLLGAIVLPTGTEVEQRAVGAQLRKDFQSRVAGIGDLIRDLKQTVRTREYIRGLDGRLLYPRNQNNALNTTLQGAGAVVVKVITNLACKDIRNAGLDAKLVLHVHDELQFLVREDHTDKVVEILDRAVPDSGEILKLKLPLEGECKIGLNWMETH